MKGSKKEQSTTSEKSPVKGTTLTDLPKELIFLIIDNLNLQSAGRLTQASSFFKNLKPSNLAAKKELTKLLDTLLFKTLHSLNHYDLYFLALKNEVLAQIVVSSPSLAEKLNQSLWGDNSQKALIGYVAAQYKPENCLDETGKRYRMDIPKPLVYLAKEYPSVASMLASDDYKVVDIPKDLKETIKNIHHDQQMRPKSPS